MGLIDRILSAFRLSPSNPAVFVPESTRSFVLGPSVVDPFDRYWGRSPETFSPEEYGAYVATSNPIYSAVRLRAELFASLPVKLYTGGGTSKQKEVTEGIEWEFFRKVNPRWTRRRWLEMTSMSCDLWGVAYTFVNKTARGIPAEMWWARPDRVYVLPDPDDYIAGFVYQPLNGSRPITFTSEETLWLPKANPLDEFAGLAPLAAARLAADTSRDAMQSNRNLFVNGLQVGGMVFPTNGAPAFTAAQKKEIADALNRSHKGVENAHRWGVFDREIGTKTDFMTPKDAEFVELMKWSLEDVSRAYGIPLDPLGGQRTYANMEASERLVWMQSIRPHADFFAQEITEQLLPMFRGRVDLFEFDFSGVESLKESENDLWQREADMIAKGRKTINEVRKDHGEPPVPWGDDVWLPINLVPIGGPMAAKEEADAKAAAEQAAQAMQQGAGGTNTTDDDGADDDGLDGNDAIGRTRHTQRLASRTIEYGSPEHERLSRLFLTRTQPHEDLVASTTTRLMRSQRQAILARLRQQDGRAVEKRIAEVELLEEIFTLSRWIREFRTAIRPILHQIADEIGTATMDDLNLAGVFDVSDPNVVRALERQAQRFAVEVNQTTWDALRTTLAEGLIVGEGTDDLAKRVERVMGSRIRSSGEVIARTEVAAASSLGSIESARQSGVVVAKEWMAAIDARTRATHVKAHGQRVGLDESFTVGSAKGPGPGMMSRASESCNCRCSMRFVTDVEASLEPRAQNGHQSRDLLRIAELVGLEVDA